MAENLPNRAHVITGGFPPGSLAGHDHDHARLKLLGLLADAGMAGLLFWMPTLLIGTPVIEFRTMLLLGLTLAMPYLAARVPLARSLVMPPRHAAT